MGQYLLQKFGGDKASGVRMFKPFKAFKQFKSLIRNPNMLPGAATINCGMGSAQRLQQHPV